MFGPLDFIYLPSRDAAADVRYFADTLAAATVFTVEGMGTRVAMVRLNDDGPPLLLAEHLEGDRPVLVYRVPDLDRAMADLGSRGWTLGHRLEIPFGPLASFTTPGGQRLAIYQRDRPEAETLFAGRRDF